MTDCWLMKLFMIPILKIITIIDRACDMSKTTAKTVINPTSYLIKLTVELIFYWEGDIVHEEKTASYPVSA